MALVGTLLFCEDCGSLLDRHPPEQLLIKCDICFKQNSSMFLLEQMKRATR